MIGLAVKAAVVAVMLAASPPVQEMTAEVTAYTLQDGSGCGLTATGVEPVEGVTCAVDPRVIPLGSKVWIKGFGWRVAQDTGGMIKGNCVDVFVTDRRAAFQWGRRQVTVRWIEPSQKEGLNESEH